MKSLLISISINIFKHQTFHEDVIMSTDNTVRKVIKGKQWTIYGIGLQLFTTQSHLQSHLHIYTVLFLFCRILSFQTLDE